MARYHSMALEVDFSNLTIFERKMRLVVKNGHPVVPKEESSLIVPTAELL